MIHRVWIERDIYSAREKRIRCYNSWKIWTDQDKGSLYDVSYIKNSTKIHPCHLCDDFGLNWQNNQNHVLAYYYCHTSTYITRWFNRSLVPSCSSDLRKITFWASIGQGWQTWRTTRGRMLLFYFFLKRFNNSGVLFDKFRVRSLF